MNSFIILVDAGYVYAAGGLLVHNTTARHELMLNTAKLRDFLEPFARKHTEVRMLRMYWYDAAPDRMATREQKHVASLQGVKLRLGRLTAKGVQKGVDSLIYRDLFTLSRSGRVSDAFLLAGDEDLLEGVLAAQEMGVRVSLIGIEPSDSNQSASLRQAADAIYVLQREALAAMLHRRSKEGPQLSTEHQPSSPTGNDKGSDNNGDRETANSVEEIVAAAGRQVAGEFWQQADETDRAYLKREVLSSDPNRRLPQRTDAWMLRVASEGLGRRLDEIEKRVARAEFWKEVAKVIGVADPSSVKSTLTLSD